MSKLKEVPSPKILMDRMKDVVKNDDQINLRFPKQWNLALKRMVLDGKKEVRSAGLMNETNLKMPDLLRGIIHNYLSNFYPLIAENVNEEKTHEMIWFKPEVLERYQNDDNYILDSSSLKRKDEESYVSNFIDCIRKNDDKHLIGAQLKYLVTLSSEDQNHWNNFREINLEKCK